MTKPSTDEMIGRQTVLKGPPGLLFGLTFLVLIAAAICLRWGPNPKGDETTGLTGAAAVALPSEGADAPGPFQPALSIPSHPRDASFAATAPPPSAVKSPKVTMW